MPPLPVLKSEEVIKVFEKFGWKVIRQKGSHIILTKEGSIVSLSVPKHKEVAKGTLRSLINKSGLVVDEFIKKLNE